MPSLDLTRCTAVITGASSGLGAEFARQLSERAEALVLIARREAEMVALAETLRRDHPALQIVVVPCDLADAAQRALLPGHLAALGLRPNVLINNAGLGDYGEFVDATWDRMDRVLQVNVVAVAHLIHLFLPDLMARPPAGILNVSSLAGELPVPDFALYAAAKACVTRLSEALRLELKAAGVHVSALCPGPVRTGFGDTARRPGHEIPEIRRAWQPVERVAAMGLRALCANRPTVVPGFLPKLTAFGAHWLPAPVRRAILAWRPRRRVGRG